MFSIGIPKDKLCDESAIELKVEAKVQWFLLQTSSLSSCSPTVQPPLSCGNPLLSTYSSMKQDVINLIADEKSYLSDDDDKWLSQVNAIIISCLLRRIKRSVIVFLLDV